MTPLSRAGIAVAVAGAAAGLFPLHFHGTSCGTAWIASGDARTADLARTLGGAPDDGLAGLSPFEDGCGGAKQPLRVGSGLLLVLGAGLAVAGVPRRRDEDTPQNDEGRPRTPSP